MMNLKTGVSRKQSTPNLRRNKHFLPLDMHGGTPLPLFRKFGVLCFLKTLVLRLALLPYNRRSVYDFLVETRRERVNNT